MYLEIVTPEASLVAGEIESIIVPGVEGEFQMLNNHAPIVSVLQEGKVKFKGNPTIAEAFQKKFTQEDGKWVLQISGGTVECNNNRVMVLAD
ncbi:FoF1 ATP synthase subunit delta/epsilon [Aequorivita lipolytica]|uniref:F0F1 ATP synthase subunit epsilon n=1 Tax=Aequorivita lipolytica TaxID=153267 RepID=A0A5C6YPT1_9FLAO|nr:F0F1 ATP synthase subunit epsilon [Aequorivita lipolytica]TXD69361.1 F0F1 ATP synthase subunit epsilon [Aequorivita lipolytica]SRX53712.1 ATP synthase epsilon chain [Aequorivita lipolytica]